MLVGQLGLVAGADSVEGDLAQVFRMVVAARRKSLQPVCQPVDGRLKSGVIVVWEYYVEAAVELGSSKLAKVLVGKG